MTGNFPGKLVLSLRQTDFQTLRAVKIGPLPCGGHASSATGGAVPARPLIRRLRRHLPPEGKVGRTESSAPTVFLGDSFIILGKKASRCF